ncbi:MAG: hypothetical protein KAJ49_05270 [Arcobacteraceae bacterium]|nr:hypothetical protein [Arcobacteraceae bacterium]
MAKGKKTTIREIKLISEDIISINEKEYVIIENTSDIETAITMKISSNGNRILRFEDINKKATIDVKRDIDVFKYSFTDSHRASRFKKTHDKTILTPNDKVDLIENTTSFIKARAIISRYTSKDSKLFDREASKTNFYISVEAK